MGLSEASFSLLQTMLAKLEHEPIGAAMLQPHLHFDDENTYELKVVAVLKCILTGAVDVSTPTSANHQKTAKKRRQIGGGAEEDTLKMAGLQALKVLLLRAEVRFDEESDSEEEDSQEEDGHQDTEVEEDGKRGRAGGGDVKKRAFIDVNELLSFDCGEDVAIGTAEWLLVPWVLACTDCIVTARLQALLSAAEQGASAPKSAPKVRGGSKRSSHGGVGSEDARTKVTGGGGGGEDDRGESGGCEMLEWLRQGREGVFDEVRWVQEGREVAVGRIAGKCGNITDKTSGKVFAHVSLWVASLPGGAGGVWKVWGWWDCLYLGDKSLRSVALQNMYEDIAEEDREGDVCLVDSKAGGSAGKKGGGGGDSLLLTPPAVGYKERSALAQRVRDNETILLRRVREWIVCNQEGGATYGCRVLNALEHQKQSERQKKS